MAWSTLVARSYSNGAGSCMLERCPHAPSGAVNDVLSLRLGGTVPRPVTLTQLGAFVLVARLGSVRAAAQVLGVSEPAVSQALAALRKHLDDDLLVRASNGMNLTDGGQRLITIASQMVALGAEAESAVRAAQGAPEQLRVIASSEIAELVAPNLVDGFTAKVGGVEVSLGVASTAEMPVLVQSRMADVALGPGFDRVSGGGERAHDAVPARRDGRAQRRPGHQQ